MNDTVTNQVEVAFEQVGFMEVQRTAEHSRAHLARHGAVGLVAQQPSGGVLHARFTFGGQVRNVGLDQAVEMDVEGLNRQRHPDVLHQGAGGQQSLWAIAGTTVELDAVLQDKTSLRTVRAKR